MLFGKSKREREELEKKIEETRERVDFFRQQLRGAQDKVRQVESELHEITMRRVPKADTLRLSREELNAITKDETQSGAFFYNRELELTRQKAALLLDVENFTAQLKAFEERLKDLEEKLEK